MADFNYIRSVDTADRLIAKFGGKLKGQIIRPRSSGGVRPVELPPELYPCTCVVVDYTERERSNSSIKAGSRRILLSPKGLSITLDAKDRIIASDGETYKIVSPMTILKPRDVIVMYDLQVEK